MSSRSTLAVCLLSSVAFAAVAKAPPKPPEDGDCLACHEDPAAARANGSPVVADAKALGASVHGQAGVACVDCHADLARASEFPHAEELAPAACSGCHDEPAAQYAESIHAQGREKKAVAGCADCHGGHDVRGSRDAESRTHPLKIEQTCARCHGNEDTIRRAGIEAGNVPAAFEDSIHGVALREKGLVVAPHCASCHGAHDIRRAADEKSRVHHATVPATCGTCHQGILAPYASSVHGKAVRDGNRAAAVCSDCHSAHGIKAAAEGWRLDVVKECGTCHAGMLKTFRDGFHGKATALGFTRAATCAGCHGAHDIQHVADANSRVALARRVETCQRCHPQANANFAQYDPHADPAQRERNAVLHYTERFMKLLLGGVFAFFSVHTALWLPRSYRARREARVASLAAPGGEA